MGRSAAANCGGDSKRFVAEDCGGDTFVALGRFSNQHPIERIVWIK